MRGIGQTWPGNVQGSPTGTTADAPKTGNQTSGRRIPRAGGEFRRGTSPWSSSAVTVAGKPGAPDLRTTVSTTAVAVTVSWPAVSTGGKALTGYRAEWREDATGNWTAHPATGHTTIPGTVNGFTIEAAHGLQPNTVYDFRVRADNPDRQSDWSNTAQATATVNIGAIVTATDPSPLTEGALDGATRGSVGLVGAQIHERSELLLHGLTSA